VLANPKRAKTGYASANCVTCGPLQGPNSSLLLNRIGTVKKELAKISAHKSRLIIIPVRSLVSFRSLAWLTMFVSSALIELLILSVEAEEAVDAGFVFVEAMGSLECFEDEGEMKTV
jgi:hypothetical protein